MKPIGLISQRIWAADINKEVINQTVTINVRIFRQGGTKDSINVKWGDGTVEVLTPPAINIYPSGLYLETYYGIHMYEEPGVYEISFVDGFLVEDVVNIEDSGNKSIHFRDSLNVRSSDSSYHNNFAPQPLGYPAGDIHNDDGVIVFNNLYQTDEFFNAEKWLSELAPFPCEGYTFPASTDSLSLHNSTVYWDKPVSPGIYAFNIRIREFLHNGTDDSLYLSTTNRVLMVEIDSSMIISSTPITNSNELLLTLYPNPVREQLHVLLGSISGNETLITIYDVNGIQMYQEDVTLSRRLETVTISVSNWPEGIYFLNVRENGRDVAAKRFLVSN